jgi:hypothetical protein
MSDNKEAVAPELMTAMRKTAGFFGNLAQLPAAATRGFASGNLQDVERSMKITGGGIATAALAGYAMKSIIQEFMNDHKRKAMLEDLMLNDPIISRAEPTTVKEYYATIHYMAPKLSADKNIVRELLQNFVKFGRVDIASVKTLADTQKSMDARVGKMQALMKG